MRGVILFLLWMEALFALDALQLRALLVARSFPIVGELYKVESHGDGSKEMLYFDLATKKYCKVAHWHDGLCDITSDQAPPSEPFGYVFSPMQSVYLCVSVQSNTIASFPQCSHFALSLEWGVEDGKIYFVDNAIERFPGVIASHDTSGFVWDLECVGDTLYVADGEGGLQIYDLSGSHLYNPLLLAERLVEGEAIAVKVYNGTIYVGTNEAIYLFDAVTLQRRKRIALPNTLYFFHVTPSGLYVALVDGRLFWYGADSIRSWNDCDPLSMVHDTLYCYKDGVAKISLPQHHSLQHVALPYGLLAAREDIVVVAHNQRLYILRGDKIMSFPIDFEPVQVVAAQKYFYLVDSYARIARVDPQTGRYKLIYTPYPVTTLLPYRKDVAIVGLGGAGFVIMKLK